ncbi:hypothetical protein D3C79_796670 [compost metagenome]
MQPAFKLPPVAALAASHLQALDAGEKLHGIGQPGCTGQLARQQAWQQALAQRLVGALQQVFDEGALAPADERRRQ